MATHSLVAAILSLDTHGVAQSLQQGANPNATIPSPGVVGESLALWACRHGEARILDLLVAAGAATSPSVMVAAGMLVERATSKQDAVALSRAKAVVEVLEGRGGDWGASERFLAGGARAIDLLAKAQPEWAQQPAQRLGIAPRKLEPEAGAGAPPRAGRVRRA